MTKKFKKFIIQKKETIRVAGIPSPFLSFFWWGDKKTCDCRRFVSGICGSPQAITDLKATKKTMLLFLGGGGPNRRRRRQGT